MPAGGDAPTLGVQHTQLGSPTLGGDPSRLADRRLGRTSRNSFRNLRTWAAQLQRLAETTVPEVAPVWLVDGEAPAPPRAKQSSARGHQFFPRSGRRENRLRLNLGRPRMSMTVECSGLGNASSTC